MSDKLLPCPFCGGESRMGGSLHVGYWVACDYCELWMGYDATHGSESGIFGSRAEAIRAWNTRATPKVKALEWESSLNGRWIGAPPIKLANLAFWVLACDKGFKRVTVEGNVYHPTLAEAKAAAQADYEARILAALEVTP